MGFHTRPFTINVGGTEARMGGRVPVPTPPPRLAPFGSRFLAPLWFGSILFCLLLTFAHLLFTDGFGFFEIHFSPASPFTRAIISCLDHFPNLPSPSSG